MSKYLGPRWPVQLTHKINQHTIFPVRLGRSRLSPHWARAPLSARVSGSARPEVSSLPRSTRPVPVYPLPSTAFRSSLGCQDGCPRREGLLRSPSHGSGAGCEVTGREHPCVPDLCTSSWWHPPSAARWTEVQREEVTYFHLHSLDHKRTQASYLFFFNVSFIFKTDRA